ncbi:hypothetical protein [Granulicella mallensis]|uniref:Uncharacterized protein n=1 Tax=Granulicella mallensis (strain ATCC BAA-1857 / DSM 23137 / MP5ACTX8) TaxID=682795 RepID=G8NYU9_GRAMM|nr:hypothetical protein [Granulicella mallensis]AEU34512.1 hypothetical protein AciX8_0154 [Granulicella mallensis MP5ACTX8]
MARAAANPTSRSTVKLTRSTVRTAPSTGRLNEVLAVAKEHGLLSGTRTHVLRGRMPASLVEQAKRKSGITSDSKLLEAALANLAVADDYWQWLHSQCGTINPDVDLEF